jgi:Spy/CpxP family protein refolding chaperone
MRTLFPPGRIRLLGFGVVAVTFVVGGLAGAAVDRVLTADVTSRDAPRAATQQTHVIDQVEMTAEQRARIDAILERRSERMKAAWSEMSPRLEAITDSARHEIMQVLTPAQQAEYERRLDDRIRSRDEARERDAGSNAGSNGEG